MLILGIPHKFVLSEFLLFLIFSYSGLSSWYWENDLNHTLQHHSYTTNYYDLIFIINTGNLFDLRTMFMNKGETL